MIQHLNPRPGLRYSGAGARVVEPDVYFIKDGDDYIIQMNDEDVPQLRLNAQYRKMLDRDNGATKEVRDYVRERYTSAIQLMKNIEQRKQTIMKVCQAIVRRQTEFLAHGLDYLKPMMIKEVAEEVGVHPSTVSRAVASKYVHTPQGVFELRYFFSEAVQGPSGGGTPLLLLKRKVKKMIEEEDRSKPLTDEQITALLQTPGHQCHPAHGGQVPRGYEDSLHAPAARPELTVRASILEVGIAVGGTHEDHLHRQAGGTGSGATEETGGAICQDRQTAGRQSSECEAHVVLSLERHLHHAEVTVNYYNHPLVGLGFEHAICSPPFMAPPRNWKSRRSRRAPSGATPSAARARKPCRKRRPKRPAAAGTGSRDAGTCLPRQPS